MKWLREEWFAIALTAVIVFPNALWFFDTAPPTQIEGFKAVEAEVPPGGLLRIDYRVTRVRACPGRIQRIIIDKQGVTHLIAPYDFLATDLNPNGREEINRVAAPIPVGAAPGPATYRAEIEYYCNPQQRLLGWPIRVVTPTIQFDIAGEAIDPQALKLPYPGLAFNAVERHARRSDLGPRLDRTIRSWLNSAIALANW